MALTASSRLFYWSADQGLDPIGGGGPPVFSRLSTAYFHDKGRKIARANYNAARFGWAQLDALRGRQPVLLLEPARTNKNIYSEAIDSWANEGSEGSSVTANTHSAPDGTLTADTVTSLGATANNGRSIDPVLTGDGAKSYSGCIKQLTSTAQVLLLYDLTAGMIRHMVQVTWTAGVPVLSSVAGSGLLFTPIELTDGWWDIAFSNDSVVAANSHRLFYNVNAPGGGTTSGLLWGSQLEDDPFPTSYIKTVGAPATRATDQFYWKNAPGPQALAVYLRFVVQQYTYGLTFFRFGDAAGGVPRFFLYMDSNAFALQHHNGTTSVDAYIAYAPVVGDVVEIVAVLRADGSIKVVQSVNAGAPTSSGFTATLALQPAWSGPAVLFLNSESTTGGYNAAKYESLRAVKLADMSNQPGTATDLDVMNELRGYILDTAGNLLVA